MTTQMERYSTSVADRCAHCDVLSDCPMDRRACAVAAGQEALARQLQFVADASHELRSPVTGLRVELEEAVMHPEETDLHELLQRALKNVNRLEGIVADLLHLARPRAGASDRWEDLDLADLVRYEVLRRSDRIPVRLRLTSGVTVHAVPVQLVRALTGLLDNAQRHADRLVEVRVHRRDGRAELVVADDGEEAGQADRDWIFECFTRLDSARCRDKEGAGLGLAIAREIAQAHHGCMGVRRSAVGGACFVLRLPLLV
ncbi:sensor histidine kinase [Nonomuraea jiangxiensis]|uniref:histidine kinase n=1 Tax=Nonomuraea jiangxiensis TaxID=633440 RepID=A0A1G9Q721_9ACTN|nr:HAMP domain-containing sensor histidine kinase [Nonomuraea jiangxiensis]SDM06551.1 His Kinase A (phospho-acceptor) domain-containing protein [Nonomuraea jiangxiensis]